MGDGKQTIKQNGGNKGLLKEPWSEDNYCFSFPPEDLQEIMETILEQMSKLVESDICLGWLFIGSDLRLVASRGLPDPIQGVVYPKDSWSLLMEEMILNKKPTLWDEEMFSAAVKLNEPSYKGFNKSLKVFIDFLRTNMKSIITAPLLYQDKILGLLAVVNKEEENYYSQRDAQSVMVFANQAAITMENVRLVKKTSHQLKMMHVLHNITVDISSQLKLQQVLNAIFRQATRLLNAKGSTLTVCEPETKLADIVALHNIPFEYEELAFRSGVSVASQVLATGKPVIINDVDDLTANNPDLDSRYGDFADPPYDAVLSVPLIWEGEVKGVLTVVNGGKRRPFTDEDARFLSLLANLAGVAFNNAEMYRRLEHKVEERTRELSEAREELAQKVDQLQRLLAVTVYLQEEERTRIARDLHDGYNQLINGTLFQIQAAKECMRSGRSEMAMEAMNTVKELLLQIEAENRRVISDLRPPVLEAHDLEAALHWLAATCQEYCEAVCEVQVFGQPFRLAFHVEITVFRIVQESLNNVAAYAGAENVNIRLEFKPNHLRMSVTDDGQGFDAGRILPKGRMGLIGMQERAQSIGGQLTVSSEPGQGTRVALELPLPAPELPPINRLGTALEILGG